MARAPACLLELGNSNANCFKTTSQYPPLEAGLQFVSFSWPQLVLRLRAWGLTACPCLRLLPASSGHRRSLLTLFIVCRHLPCSEEGNGIYTVPVLPTNWGWVGRKGSIALLSLQGSWPQTRVSSLFVPRDHFLSPSISQVFVSIIGSFSSERAMPGGKVDWPLDGTVLKGEMGLSHLTKVLHIYCPSGIL